MRRTFRVRHALLAAMFAALILHAFQIVLSRHRNSCFPQRTADTSQKRLTPLNAFDRDRVASVFAPPRGSRTDMERVPKPKVFSSSRTHASQPASRPSCWSRSSNDGDRIGADSARSRSFERGQCRTGCDEKIGHHDRHEFKFARESWPKGHQQVAARAPSRGPFSLSISGDDDGGDDSQRCRCPI